MGDLIPFPVDRRREPPKKPPPGDPFAPLHYPGSGTTAADGGALVEYVNEGGWFGVRLRPPVTPA